MSAGAFVETQDYAAGTVGLNATAIDSAVDGNCRIVTGKPS